VGGNKYQDNKITIKENQSTISMLGLTCYRSGLSSDMGVSSRCMNDKNVITTTNGQGLGFKVCIVGTL